MKPVFQRRISVTSPFREIFAAAALALLASMHVEAQTFEQSLVYMLPVYCKYTQIFRDRVSGGNNRAEIERWTTSMGATFNHMHHYCLGLMASNRAAFFSNTREDRIHNLSNSVEQFEYVIERPPPDFPLLPQILTKKGESLIRLDRAGEGVLSLQRAIKIKADYWAPYAAMSDYYKETGQLAKAREWLQKGLSVAPNANGLTRRLAELDGAKDKRKNAPKPATKPSAASSPQ